MSPQWTIEVEPIRAFLPRLKQAVPDGTKIELLTPETLAALPDGTEIISIHGEVMVKGTDPIDDDTRAGYLAFGVRAAPEGEPT